MEKVPMTTRGYARLQEELKTLKTIERPAVIKAIAQARELGDLSENAEYHAAREKQGFIEGRIAEIEDRIRRAEVIDVSKMTGSTVKFGAHVCLFDEETEEETKYQIVGLDEASVEEGLISITSPLARALISKGVGDRVEVNAPRGSKYYEIISVTFE